MTITNRLTLILGYGLNPSAPVSPAEALYRAAMTVVETHAYAEGKALLSQKSEIPA